MSRKFDNSFSQITQVHIPSKRRSNCCKICAAKAAKINKSETTRAFSNKTIPKVDNFF